MQNSVLSTRITCLYGSPAAFVVFALKTETLASELLNSMGPSPNLRFFLVKQRLLDKNYKSPRVPDLTFRFVHEKQRDYHKNC